MRLLISLFVLSLLTACTPPLMNLTNAKNEVENYYESGQYENELNKIVSETLDQLNEIELPGNPAVIFDVDETVLSNYSYIKELGFGYKHDLWQNWLKESKATAINPTKQIYKWCIDNNIKVVFLTGRSKDVYQQTYRNLLLQGFTEIEKLICRSASELKLSATEFKSNQRKTLSDSGYNIIATIGDLNSDLAGDNTGLKVKLPNYLYDFD
ncbi:MAG: HAD family acid phosphatase [Melioribacteraceae bacterium]|nr:HAD family acid phosphatase [Melioribacteraceae bacterium]